MGVNLKSLLVRREVTFEELDGKILAFDAYNMLFQFLSSIRDQDGRLLTNSQGQVTSHIIGLFSRASTFLERGIKPIFVFDGEHPKLKHREIARRVEIKKEAQRKYEAAIEAGDTDDIRKFGARTSKLTKEMVDSAKQLLELMGIPVVQAPSEGEGQAAHIVNQGKAWAVASQDFDSVLYAAKYLVRNLSIAGKRRRPGTRQMIDVKPEIVDYEASLKALDVTREQLIYIGMLVGTDYNGGGVRGLGPKKALKLVKKFQEPDVIFEEAKWDGHCDVAWQDVLDCFTKLPVKDVEISFAAVQVDKLRAFLIDEYDFSPQRVEKTLGGFVKAKRAKSQKSLDAFF